MRLINEELILRPRLYGQGVRDVSHLVTLPKNRTDVIDNESSDYDDKRVCSVCSHTCFLSARDTRDTRGTRGTRDTRHDTTRRRVGCFDTRPYYTPWCDAMV